SFGNSIKLSQTAVAPSGAQVFGNRFRSKIGAVTLSQRIQFHFLDQRSGPPIVSLQQWFLEVKLGCGLDDGATTTLALAQPRCDSQRSAGFASFDMRITFEDRFCMHFEPEILGRQTSQ